MGRVINPDTVRPVVGPLRKPCPLRQAGLGQRTEVLVRHVKHPPHGGRRHPHPVQIRPAVREFAVRAVRLAPLVEQRQDLPLLRLQDAVHRAAAGALVGQLAVVPAHPPPVHPPDRDLQHPARPGEVPTRVQSVLDQVEQRRFGGRVDSQREPAT